MARLKAIPDGLFGCRYGHQHVSSGAADRCEEITFSRLCVMHGIDEKSERERQLNEMPKPPAAEQIEAFPECIKPKL